jgi:aspartyl-tRNA(Asn)/glutamyl-tRNA(Gln) amidotransferase subunit A
MSALSDVELHKQSITELSRALQAKEIKAVDLAQHFLNRIEQYDPAINSFITVTKDLALEQAKAADQLIAAGKAGPLTGIPYGHKDIFCTKGVKTSVGSKMLDNFIAPYDATITEKMNEAGMVMLGKLNMDEFAMGSSNENSYYGPVANPWDMDFVPGGSSGGSSAAVAANLAPIATGSDTGGSVRQPAAFCGLTGIKPTYGRVSRWGMVAFASSLDQAGIIAHNAMDAALLMNCIAGFDERDSTSTNIAVPDYTANLGDSVKGLKIGLPKEYFSNDLDPKMKELIMNAAHELEKAGATLHEITLPSMPLSVPTYYVIAPAECSSNLERFDGVRYGYRCENPLDLDDLYRRSRAEGFGQEVKRRILIGSYVLSAGFFDAYYLKAQKIRQLIRNEFAEAFKSVDVIFSPTSPHVAFKRGSRNNDPVSMYLSDIYTVSTNMAGIPGLSVAAGFIDGLPIGLQMLGPHFSEAKLLNVAHQYQQITDWHTQLATDFEVRSSK